MKQDKPEIKRPDSRHGCDVQFSRNQWVSYKVGPLLLVVNGAITPINGLING